MKSLVFIAVLFSFFPAFAKSERIWSCRGENKTTSESSHKYFRVHVLYDKGLKRYSATYLGGLTTANSSTQFSTLNHMSTEDEYEIFTFSFPTNEKTFELQIDSSSQDEFLGVDTYPATLNMTFVIKPYKRKPVLYSFDQELFCVQGEWPSN